MNTTVRAWVGVLLLLQTSGNAPAELPAATREPFAKGVAAAKQQDYPLAIRCFQDARAAAPEAPELLFNLGLAESCLPGRELRSICWLSAYLAAAPSAPNAAAVKTKIQELKVSGKRNAVRVIEAVQRAATELPSSANDLGNDADRRWTDLGLLWIDAGDVQTAERLLDRVQEFKFKGQFLLRLAYARWKAGDQAAARTDIAKARGLIEGLEQVDRRNRALKSLVEYCAEQMGDFQDAQRVADRITDPGIKDQAQCAIASCEAGVLDIGAAQQAAARITDLAWRGQAQLHIALCQARDLDFRGALETARSIQDVGGKAGALVGVAFAQCYIQEDVPGALESLKRAGELNLTTSDGRQDYEGELWMAQLQLRYGDVVGAHRTLAKAQMATNRVTALATKAVSSFVSAARQLDAGEVEAARASLLATRDALDAAPDPDWKTSLLFELGKTQIRAKDFAGARDSFASARRTLAKAKEDKEEIALEMVEAQASIGDIAGAQATAAMINDATYGLKAKAECRIAAARYNGGDVAGAKEQFSRARSTAAHAEAVMDHSPLYSAKSRDAYKRRFDRYFLAAQAKLGSPGDSWPPPSELAIVPAHWILRLEDPSPNGQCPLSLPPFLGLTAYLQAKAAQHPDNARALFDELMETAKTTMTAQDAVERMLKGEDVYDRDKEYRRSDLFSR
jgi:hypothetical protein